MNRKIVNINEIGKNIKNFEEIKNCIVPILVNPNRYSLCNRPHKMICDLAVVFAINIKEGTIGASIPIDNSLLALYRIDCDELYNLSISNMKNYNPSTFRTMNEVLQHIGINDEIVDFVGLHVLSNETGLYGASSLLDKDIMKKVREKLGDNILILPSSRHEVIILSKDGEDVECCVQMVEEINEGVVSFEDYLSDHVYTYDFDKDEIILIS